VLLFAAFALVLPTLLAATAKTLQALVWWRAAQGLCLPAIFAVTVAYVGEECGASGDGAASSGVGRVMASYVTGNIVGGVLGRFVSAFVTDRVGWREAFAVLAALNLLVAIALSITLPASRRFKPEASAVSALRELAGHLKSPRLWAGYAVGFNILFSIVGTFTYVGFYLAKPPFNLSTVWLGAIFFVYLTGAVATPLAGRVLDRLGARRVLLGAMTVASAGVALTLFAQLWLVVIGLSLCASGIFVCQSAANSYVAQSAGRGRSAAAGLYVSIYYLGGTAGAVLPGLAFRSGGWPLCVGVIVASQLLSSVIALVAWRRGSESPRSRSDARSVLEQRAQVQH
jgi:predicted MFS family arabinose efflux permease